MKIAIYCHDAGAGELLIALYEHFINIFSFTHYTIQNSPYDKLLHTKSICYVTSTQESIYQNLTTKRYDMILFGTSWQDDTEKFFLQYAKINSIPTIAFLDHWTFYDKRFKNTYPDYIATHDFYSTQIAKQNNLPNIIPIKNYYLDKLLTQYKKLDIKEKNQLLYCTEPTAEVAKKRFGNPDYWGFNEIDIYKELQKIAQQYNLSLKLRLHPSDTPQKYLAIDKNLMISKQTLIEDIAESKLIIGIDTIALYYAYVFNKYAVSYIPSNSRKATIPLPKTNIISNINLLDINTLQLGDESILHYNNIEFDTFVKEIS